MTLKREREREELDATQASKRAAPRRRLGNTLLSAPQMNCRYHEREIASSSCFGLLDDLESQICQHNMTREDEPQTAPTNLLHRR